MARYDKYDSLISGSRAKLASNWDQDSDMGVAFGVSLDGDGRVVKGSAGDTGIVGIVIVTTKMAAGEVVDIMDIGQIVEAESNGNPFPAGTIAYAENDGGLLTEDGNDATLVGYSVEEGRIRVNMALQNGGASA